MRRINLEIAGKILIVLVMEGVLAYLLISNQMQYYIHPRNTLFLVIVMICLLVVALTLLPLVKKPRYRQSYRSSWLLLIPFAAVLLFPYQPLRLDAVTVRYGASAITSSRTDSEKQTIPKIEEPGNSRYGTMIDDKHFASWYLEVANHPDPYLYKSFTYTGMVYREDGFTNTQFIPMRMAMTCCAADLSALGFISIHDQAWKYQDGDWIQVTGVLSLEYIDLWDAEVPVMHITNIERVAKPRQEIVYLDLSY